MFSCPGLLNMADKVVTLNNGHTIPLLGLGTYVPTSGDEFRTSLRSALDIGYRHLDTAYFYKNEEYVGEVLQEYFKSGKLKREDVFVTSKLWPAFHERERVSLCLAESLKRLQLDYVDLYLDHFPGAFQDSGEGEEMKMVYQDVKFEETWKAMEQLVKEGKAKSIGVSNYNMAQVQRILDVCEIKPVTNQIECHVYLQQPKMYEFLKERGITLTAYSPLGSPHRLREDQPKVLEDPIAKQLATKYNKTVGQILLRYTCQRGIIVIPKSSNPQRQKENINLYEQIFDFQLSGADMEALAKQDRKLRYNTVERLRDHPEYPFNEAV